jgi:integrase
MKSGATKMPRSTYGEGSVWYDEGRDLWFGQVYFGPGNRPKVSARKKADMVAKMRGLQPREDVPDASREHPGGVGTTGAWLNQWLAQVKRHVEPSTHTDYVRWSRLYVKPHVGAIPLRSLEAEDVENMMDALEAQGLSSKTVRCARSLLIQALDVAERRDKVRKNVARLTRGPKQTGVRINDRLDAKQAKLILKTLWGDRLYALAVLALSTGMRPMELFALQWSAVDLRRKVVHIRKSKTPAGVRSIPLSATAVAALRELPGRKGLVFTDEAGEALKHRDVTAWWHDALRRAGISRRRFYCTRHTAATLMLNNGVKLEVVSKILGHAGLAITSDVYAEVQEELQRDAATVMDDVLGF